MITQRENDILGILVRNYIRSAKPISSEFIAEKLGKTLSPATVRSTMYELTNKGYLEQPHTSSGRRPTAKAYRYYVNSLLEPLNLDKYMANMAHRIFSDLEILQEKMAEDLHVVTGIIGRSHATIPHGFKELFNEPEFIEKEMIVQFGGFFDDLLDSCDRYKEALKEKSFGIFIGRENPIRNAEHISVTIKDRGSDSYFFAAGPIRMDYENIIKFFHSI